MVTELKPIPAEAQIVKSLRRIIDGSHLFCTRCHSRLVHRSEDRYRCRGCRRPFAVDKNR